MREREWMFRTYQGLKHASHWRFVVLTYHHEWTSYCQPLLQYVLAWEQVESQRWKVWSIHLRLETQHIKANFTSTTKAQQWKWFLPYKLIKVHKGTRFWHLILHPQLMFTLTIFTFDSPFAKMILFYTVQQSGHHQDHKIWTCKCIKPSSQYMTHSYALCCVALASCVHPIGNMIHNSTRVCHADTVQRHVDRINFHPCVQNAAYTWCLLCINQ